MNILERQAFKLNLLEGVEKEMGSQFTDDYLAAIQLCEVDPVQTVLLQIGWATYKEDPSYRELIKEAFVLMEKTGRVVFASRFAMLKTYLTNAKAIVPLTLSTVAFGLMTAILEEEARA